MERHIKDSIRRVIINQIEVRHFSASNAACFTVPGSSACAALRCLLLRGRAAVGPLVAWEQVSGCEAAMMEM